MYTGDSYRPHPHPPTHPIPTHPHTKQKRNSRKNDMPIRVKRDVKNPVSPQSQDCQVFFGNVHWILLDPTPTPPPRRASSGPSES